jgi:hypothetical protein
MLTAGCGTYVPPMQEFWEGNNSSSFSAGGLLEYRIKKKVYCAIVDAVARQPALPKDWAAQVTLDLQVDETGAINPGASFINPLPNSQSFTLGADGTISSQATREDKFGSYWKLSKLTGGLEGNPCDDPPAQGSSLLIEADLGIAEWLTDALKSENYLPSSALTGKATPRSTGLLVVSYQVHRHFERQCHANLEVGAPDQREWVAATWERKQNPDPRPPHHLRAGLQGKRREHRIHLPCGARIRHRGFKRKQGRPGAANQSLEFARRRLQGGVAIGQPKS